MNLFELFAKISLKDEASKGIKKISDGLGKGLQTAAKIGLAAVGAAATGIVALTKQAVESYADYEQLVGGVETLFGAGGKNLEEYAKEQGKTAEEVADEFWKLDRAQSVVLNNANNAYKTAGLSANEYMETVTSFSASLIQSLNGDTSKAAKVADMAITDMADNANKMGTSMEMIQNAYQGFAKQNYTMLDNLKLGYGGTKEEMQRLLKDAQKISGVKYDISSFADISEAIHIMQENMGIAGTTAIEASETISGSVSSMKAAWGNLLTGMADENADFGVLVDNLVYTLAGDGNGQGGVINNLLPRIRQAILGISTLVREAAPVIIEQLPVILDEVVPALIETSTELVDAVIEVLPELVDSIVQALIDNAPMLIVAAVEIVLALASGLISAVPELIKAIPQIIEETVDELKSSKNIQKFLQVGADLIAGLREGISNAWRDLKEWFSGLFDDIIGIAKRILGIASPSKVFKSLGGFTAEGFGIGFEDEFSHVKDDMEDALNFDDASVGINSSIRSVGGGAGFGGTTIGNITINVNGANYSDEQSLAAAIAQEIQTMTDRRVAVYA